MVFDRDSAKISRKRRIVARLTLGLAAILLSATWATVVSGRWTFRDRHG
jgi:hypothetical protein